MKSAYLPPCVTLLECVTTDVIAASREYPNYSNGNMGEWDDVD